MSHNITACITNCAFDKNVSKNENARLASKALSGWSEPQFQVIKSGYDGEEAFELAALIEIVGTQGYSFCNPINGSRLDKNFIHTNLLVIDIDQKEGDTFTTIDKFLELDFNKKHLAGYYTSRSHTDQYHRFRAFYVTENLIVGRDTFHSVIIGLSTKFPRDVVGPKGEVSMIDTNAIDASRLWFGSYIDPESGSLDYFPSAETISDKDILELKKIGEVTSLKPKTHVQIRNGANVNVINSTTVDADFLYTDSKGNLFTMRDVYNDRKPRTLCCPYHHEQNPSAWVSYYDVTDNVHFNCSGCSEKRKMKNRSDTNVSISEENQNVLVLNEQFIENNNEALEMMKKLGLCTLKSHKGSGKTELIAKFVTWCKQQGLSVLIIGHRCSLLSNIASRLGLQYYKDEAGAFNKPTSYYAITFHSLPKIDRSLKYDVIIIDESEQVFLDMASKLHTKNRLERFSAMKFWLNAVDRVVLADADLSVQVSIKSLSTFVNSDKWEASQIVNKWQANNDIYILPSTGQAIDLILKDVYEGKKCFIASDNATFTEQLRVLLQTMDVKSRVLQVMNQERYEKTDTMGPSASAFIKSPISFVGAYDIIIASPAMSTGVSITEECDNVYGIFQGITSQYFNIDQAIHRVRCVKGKISVVIERSNFKDTKDQEEALDELKLTRKCVIGASIDDHIKEHVEREELEGLLVHLFTLENGFNSNQKDQFISYKQEQGSSIILVDEDKVTAKLGNELLKASKVGLKNVQAENVWHAPRLDLLAARVEQAKKGKKTDSERWSLERFVICDTLKIGQDKLTILQVEDFLKNKLLIKVRNLREHAAPESSLLEHDIKRSIDRPVQDVRMSTVQISLRNEIFQILGVNIIDLRMSTKLDELELAAPYPITQEALLEFGEYMLDNSEIIWSTFRRKCKRTLVTKNKQGKYEDLPLDKQEQKWRAACTSSASSFLRDVGLVLESNREKQFWLDLRASRVFFTTNRIDTVKSTLKDAINMFK